MDFLLVPDALTASEVRHALAKHNTVGVRVGSFQVLLDTLSELWMLSMPDERLQDPWLDSVQEHALAMDDAFWAGSISADEKATMRAITASLQFALDHCPLGHTLQYSTWDSGNEPTRYQRYYNDLVRLQKMVGLRPALQQFAENWFELSNELALEPLHLYPIYQLGAFTEQDLLPWQQSVLKALADLGCLKSEPGPYAEILASLSESARQADSAIVGLAEHLFKQPADTLVKPSGHIQWLICRDAAEEAEATAVFVQRAIGEGVKCDEIAIVVPRNTDHGSWLGHYLQRAGINASNLRPVANQFDWQTALLQNLLSYRVNPDVRMAMQSVFINPLMPWSAETGYRLASQYADYKPLDNEPAPRQSLIDLLLQPSPDDETVAGVTQWLNDICVQMEYRAVIGLSKQRLQQLLQHIQRLLDLYKDLPIFDQLQRVLSHLSAGSINVNGERMRYLNAVLVIEEGEPLPVTVKQLYVLGFNHGHYQYQPAYTGVLSRQQWDDLQLPHLPKQSTEQCRWQEGFRHLLRSVTNTLVFMRSQVDANGAKLESSDTLIDMSLCYYPLNQLSPEHLEQPLSALSGIWHSIEPCRTGKPLLHNSIELGTSLLGSFKDHDGEQRPESPSSLQTMMLSPLAWLLSRLRIESKQWGAASQTPRVSGIIAHQVFEDFRDHQHEEWSNAMAEQWFNQAVAQHAPFLSSPQFSMQKQQLRKSVFTALQALQQWLQQEGWTITATEQALSGTINSFNGLYVAGKADAVLTNDQGDVLILDYKNSKHKDRLAQLKKGYELQTRLYRELYQQQNSPEGVVNSAYYTLKDQTLVSGTAVKPGKSVKTVNPGDISLIDQSEHAEARLSTVLQQLVKGDIALNSANDEKDWHNRGVSTYTLKDNHLVQRFTLADTNSQEAD